MRAHSTLPVTFSVGQGSVPSSGYVRIATSTSRQGTVNDAEAKEQGVAACRGVSYAKTILPSINMGNYPQLLKVHRAPSSLLLSLEPDLKAGTDLNRGL